MQLAPGYWMVYKTSTCYGLRPKVLLKISEQLSGLKFPCRYVLQLQGQLRHFHSLMRAYACMRTCGPEI